MKESLTKVVNFFTPWTRVLMLRILRISDPTFRIDVYRGLKLPRDYLLVQV